MTWKGPWKCDRCDFQDDASPIAHMPVRREYDGAIQRLSKAWCLGVMKPYDRRSPEAKEVLPGKLPSGEDAPDHLVRRMPNGTYEEGA